MPIARQTCVAVERARYQLKVKEDKKGASSQGMEDRSSKSLLVRITEPDGFTGTLIR